MARSSLPSRDRCAGLDLSAGRGPELTLLGQRLARVAAAAALAFGPACAQDVSGGHAPVLVWDWAQHPSRADLARVYPTAAGPNVTGIGSITCVLDEKRRPTLCKPDSEAPDGLGFRQAALQLAPFWREPRGRGSTLPTGALITIPVTFQPAEQIILDPAFLSRDGSQRPQRADWARRPSLSEIAAIAPDPVTGYPSGLVQCTVGQAGRLESCRFAAVEMRCSHNGRIEACNPDEIKPMTPSDVRLLRLGSLLRVRSTGPDGLPSLGRQVSFSINLAPLTPAPLMIPPAPPGDRSIMRTLGPARPRGRTRLFKLSPP